MADAMLQHIYFIVHDRDSYGNAVVEKYTERNYLKPFWSPWWRAWSFDWGLRAYVLRWPATADG